MHCLSLGQYSQGFAGKWVSADETGFPTSWSEYFKEKQWNAPKCRPHFVIYFVRSSLVHQQLENRPVSYASNWMLHDLLTIWDQSGGQHEFGASC